MSHQPHRPPTLGLSQLRPTYSPLGATHPGEEHWTEAPPGFRRYERTVPIGQGSATWSAAAPAVLEWVIKTRSGFAVRPGSGTDRRVREGADYWLVAAVGPVDVREPVRVWLTLRSLTRPGRGAWRLAFPALLIAQRWYRSRYQRALRG